MQLQPLGDATLDLVVVGCGPAGMCLAAEAAKEGLSVGLVGPDLPFVNNYGVWTDEFAGKPVRLLVNEVVRLIGNCSDFQIQTVTIAEHMMLDV